MRFAQATFKAAALLAAVFILPRPGACAARPAAGADDDSLSRAAASISGSPWPGVIDHLLELPQPGETGAGPSIHINYPSFGRQDIDSDIRAWARSLADAFATHLDMGFGQQASEDAGDACADISAGQEGPFELWGEYEVSRPSPNAVSITFELWNYAGSPQGNLDIITLNYSLLSGQRLGLVDLFDDPDTAIELMSSYARKVLEKRLGGPGRLLMEGTAPLVENYSSLTLTPEGVRINFQPYQVAPWAAGAQHVDMPLGSLLPAGPLMDFWRR